MGGPVVEVHVGGGIALPVDPARVEDAVRTVLAREGVEAAEISVAFLSDQEIERLNQDYLSHEGPTDVISFTLSGPGEPLLGDVYVGAVQAARQAREMGIPIAEELVRLSVHGTLHVLGYDHPEDEDREGSAMYVRQEELLREILGGAEAADE